jgi:hypothetical protein
MNPFGPNNWKTQWDIFWTAPFIHVPLMLVAGVVGWFIATAFRVGGLKGTISNLIGQILDANA